MALLALKTFCDVGDRMQEKLVEQGEPVEELERRLRKEKAKAAAELRGWVKYSDDGTGGDVSLNA